MFRKFERILIILLTSLLAVSLTSCGLLKSDSSNTDSNDKDEKQGEIGLVGYWYCPAGDTCFNFKEDGTYDFVSLKKNLIFDGTYTYKNGEVNMDLYSKKYVENGTIEDEGDDTIKIVYKEDDKDKQIRLEKIDETEYENAIKDAKPARQ